MIQWLMLAEEPMLEHKFARFVALGLGFLFLGQQEAVEATLEVARSVHERIAKVAAVLLDTCAHAGTGNVLKVQEMLSICGETIDAEEGAEWKVRGSGRTSSLCVGMAAVCAARHGHTPAGTSRIHCHRTQHRPSTVPRSQLVGTGANVLCEQRGVLVREVAVCGVWLEC